jgi:hypothetical protein
MRKMRRLITVMLLGAFLMTFFPALPVQAASDVVWTSDTTLTKFINRYNNCTIKAGVTVTMKQFSPDPQGLEISGSLTVEPGGRLTGPGVIIFNTTSTYSGIDLYYTVNGVEKLLPEGNFLKISEGNPADYRPHFSLRASGHYVLIANFNADPYEVPEPPKTPAPAGSGTPITGNTVPVYRLFRPTTGEHLYTINATERDSFTAAGWIYEGEAWYTPAQSDIPVYRLYHKEADYHHYTTGNAERGALIAAGWEDQGIGWYSGGQTPLYRLYNPAATPAGSHHYTMSAEERNVLLNSGWIDEGVGWYGK